MTKTFTVQTERQFREGWGVHVTTIWEGEEEPTLIADIEVSVIEISERNWRMVGGVPCAPVPGTAEKMFVSLENFRDLGDLWQDDSHDLRCRWFATKDAAESHADGVRDLWAHPNPWTSFCVVE